MVDPLRSAAERPGVRPAGEEYLVGLIVVGDADADDVDPVFAVEVAPTAFVRSEYFGHLGHSEYLR